MIKDDDGSRYSIKVKGNNIETFNRKMKEIERILTNEKGVKIEPQKIICVNRRDYSKTKEKKERHYLNQIMIEIVCFPRDSNLITYQ